MLALNEYLALQRKVDAFADSVGAQHRQHMQCQAGCAACCHTELSVSGVEAAAISSHLDTLPADHRGQLRIRAAALASSAPAGADTRCVMLDDQNRCQIYAARPLVCRTQGLPLRYPAELIPPAAVRIRGGAAAVTWCPLNFTAVTPSAAAILNAERVDELLALINQRHAAACSGNPLDRSFLIELALKP